MKSNPKIKTIIIIAIGIFIGFSTLSNDNLNFNTGNSDKINLDTENMKLSVVSGKIHIDGNLGWANAKTAGICTGNGTYSEPYVIEDLVIDGGGSGICILIGNSSVYFMIENCTIYNSGGTGIKLDNVNNGYLINNNCSYAGISLFESDSNYIVGNNISYSKVGIFLWYSCDNNVIAFNILNYHSQGIDLYFQCYYNTVSGNTVNNTYTGIVLQAGSDYNTVSGNTLIVNDECITSYDQGFRDNSIFNNSCVVLEDEGDGDKNTQIPGYNLLFLLGILSVVVIIISKKLKKS